MYAKLLQKPLFLFRFTSIGDHATLGDYERRKLLVFNQLNFLGILSGLIVTVAGLFDEQNLPFIATIVAFAPVVISAIVLYLNLIQKYEAARLVYFILYPLITSMVYGAGLDVGLELFFVLYSVLGVFYMQKPANAVITFAFSAVCYVFVFVMDHGYAYELRKAYYAFYFFNHVLALVFLFFALFWSKKENLGYQLSILSKNDELNASNLEKELQRKEIETKAEQLTELNTVKNKLFSVIAHDLKGPLYAQRNLIRGMHQHDMPAAEIKMLIPDILSDMNYTVSLMDNLLQWAKSQMESESAVPQLVDLSELIDNVTSLLRLQAKSKEIYLQNKLNRPVYVYADKEMLHMVLRNLLSNAIKFTPEKGNISVRATTSNQLVEISVADSGVGMTEEVLERLTHNNYFTTKGTANEAGTGLGLMLCKEFLHKIGSNMKIRSKHGEGSTFSFALPEHN
ncbi:MAG: HAMP domain-containing sensor histidine kinase [Chitinophagaceae bacterium]